MKRFGTALAGATILTAVISAQQPAPAAPLLSPGPAAARFPRNLEEFDQMFNQIKNWEHWGQDDQLGAANLITEARRRQALSLAKNGITVSLAHPPIKEQAADNPNPFNHTMNRGLTTDTYSVSYHGYAHSHIDRCATCSTRTRPTTGTECLT